MTKNRLLRAIHQIPSCVFFKDTKCRYKFASKRWEQLNNTSIYGKTDLEIRKDKENAEYAMCMDKKVLSTGKGISYTIKSEIDGHTEYLEIIKEPVFNMFGKIIGIAGLINNITDKVLLNQELERLSSTDFLTNTMNRKSGTNLINQLLEENSHKLFCLLDIDNFKKYNDKYGHRAGDIVLQQVSKVLLDITTNEDVVMRLGGDEFVILLNNTDESIKEKFIEKLFNCIDKITIPKISDKITISIGLTEVKKDSTFDSLYARADRNMYRAKREKGNYYVFE